ncbi:uncharacterized protein N0V89_007676 [Didymosphaeria variabile]|uniref:Hamartin n=1 Tax=Didymosphaeria variabile TaxID=1932322 RepID=A0A9W9CAH9_9PLEO|nr:uncharacterized protein N0V89_007676 [Didymosphaeria variabile]KAJ4352328.1 hypothetical protein N0V89_007676 [Didymosphaeria variabile]
MAGFGTMRETLKALNTTFAAPAAPYPLPEELRDTIARFLEKYDDIDDTDSQRFHDDLLPLYNKHVANNPENLGPFLSVLRAVRPALTGEARLGEWWDLVLKPTIDSVGHKKHELEEAKELLLSFLVYEVHDDKDKDKECARLSDLFLRKTLDVYLARTKVPSETEDIISPEDDYISNEVESVLVAFGRKQPKELLLAVDELFVQKRYRTQALILLNAFVRLQTPHLHVVLETQLIQHLEKCLLIDTSASAVGQALVVLIMFLPHITSALTSDHHLPRLFLIYSRLICWDKFGSSSDATDTESAYEDDVSDSSDEEDSDPAWEQLQHSAQPPDTSPPTALLHYFTFLYGLFPLNFMSFVRKPRKLLKSMNFPGADDFDLDPDLLHSRTEPYRRVHLLHPNMFSTTIEDELTENRWLDSDPADVVMECMELCVAVSTTLDDPGPPPTSKLPDLPVPPIPETEFALDDGITVHDSTASWRNTQSTMVASSATSQPDIPDSFELPENAKAVTSASPLLQCKDVIESPTLPPTKEAPRKQSFLSAPSAAPQRLTLHTASANNFAQTISVAGSPTQSEFKNLSMAALQREIMLLRNDLNFERYLKAQHIAHIGQMQRKHIKEATAEADTQNLINTNKTLKAKLAKMNEQYAQLKKETLTRRNQTQNWERELTGKVKSYREDSKSRHDAEETLRFELRKVQTDFEHLKKIVEIAEAKELRAKQRTEALEFELEDYGNMQKELEAAQEKIAEYESQSKDLNSLIQQRNELRNDLELTHMRLNSRELERERAIKAYERRIMELESRLQSAEKSAIKPGQLPPSMQQMVDSVIAQNNSKMANMKKMYQRLQEQKMELEMEYHELRGEHQALVGRLRHDDGVDTNDRERDALSRNFSARSSGMYDSRLLPPLTSDISPGYDGYGQHLSPTSPTSPSFAAPPRQPRLDSLARSHVQNYGHDFSGPYEQSLNALFENQNAAVPGQSSGQSEHSAETSSSKGEKRDRAAAKPDPRPFYGGRGGAQNFSSKKKETKDPKKAAEKKTGGFRGLRNIV